MESFNMLQDIREIFHGSGERKPRMDTVKQMQSVLLKQMALLMYKTHEAALNQHCSQIRVKHVIYVLRHHKLTLIRMLSYYLLKDSFPRFNSMNQTTNALDEANSLSKVDKSIDTHFVEGALDTEYLSQQYIDPTSFLKSLKFKSSVYKSRKKQSLFWKICSAITQLKLDLEINQEDIDNSTLERKIRVDTLSIKLSNDAYDSFQWCRRKNFHNKLGTMLMSEVDKALPRDVLYRKDAKELLLFLAKETIVCLYDRVCKNRKLEELDPTRDVQDTYIKKYVTVDEIVAVTSAAWNPAFGEISIPFTEDNTFFSNPLIFD